MVQPKKTFAPPPTPWDQDKVTSTQSKNIHQAVLAGKGWEAVESDLGGRILWKISAAAPKPVAMPVFAGSDIELAEYLNWAAELNYCRFRVSESINNVFFLRIEATSATSQVSTVGTALSRLQVIVAPANKKNWIAGLGDRFRLSDWVNQVKSSNDKFTETFSIETDQGHLAIDCRGIPSLKEPRTIDDFLQILCNHKNLDWNWQHKTEIVTGRTTIAKTVITIVRR